MKKLMSIILALILVLSLVGCKTQEVEKQKYVGFSTITTQGDFMSLLATGIMDKMVAAGCKFETASADLNVAKQIEQIENFITLGVDELIIMAVDPSSLADVIKKAQSKGIKVVAFSQKTPTYDLYLGADETQVGTATAEMAAKWIDKTFPDAKAGSVQVAIFDNRDKPTATERSDGFKAITTFTDKATVVKTVGVDTTTKGGQSAAENLLLTNPEVKVVICYNGDTAMGVDSYAMALNSNVKDKANFGIFSVDFNPAAGDAITKSAKNESVWRGTIMMGKGLEDLIQIVSGESLKLLNGTLEEKENIAELFPITAENVPPMGK